MFEEECKKGQVVATIKFETFAEQWFEEYAKINLRNTSFERMKQLTARVYPAIGHLRLDKITGRHIQQFINSTSERTGRTLARKTVIHHLSFISDVFSYAVKMDMLTYNPCRKVTVPKGEAKEKDIYTIEEITRIFELLNGENVPTKFRVFFKLAVYSGYRRGELLGLEWKDVDFENNTIKVRRTSNYTAKKGIYTDTTKTKKSQRTQKYPQYVMDMLWELRKEQDEQCARMGDKWQDYDRLFIKWDGSPMNDSSLEIYDYILIDCPPSLGMLVHNALAAADGIIVPVQTQMFSVNGLIQFEQVVNAIRKNTNKNLTICGIVETMVDNTKMTKEVDEVLSKEYSDLVYSTKIPRRIEAAYSSANRKSLIRSNSSSIGKQYRELVVEILAREGE